MQAYGVHHPTVNIFWVTKKEYFPLDLGTPDKYN